jgi:hypothetical protein
MLVAVYVYVFKNIRVFIITTRSHQFLISELLIKKFGFTNNKSTKEGTIYDLVSTN